MGFSSEEGGGEGSTRGLSGAHLYSSSPSLRRHASNGGSAHRLGGGGYGSLRSFGSSAFDDEDDEEGLDGDIIGFDDNGDPVFAGGLSDAAEGCDSGNDSDGAQSVATTATANTTSLRRGGGRSPPPQQQRGAAAEAEAASLEDSKHRQRQLTIRSSEEARDSFAVDETFEAYRLRRVDHFSRLFLAQTDAFEALHGGPSAAAAVAAAATASGGGAGGGGGGKQREESFVLHLKSYAWPDYDGVATLTAATFTSCVDLL